MAVGISPKVITIATAGTPTQVDSSTERTERMNILNPFSNTGVVYFGASSSMDATTRRRLERGEAFDLFNVVPANIYVDVAVNNESVEVVFYI